MADLITAAELAASVPKMAGRADLALLIGAASNAVERYCGRSFTSAEVTETHYGVGPSGRVYLRRPPVTALLLVGTGGATPVVPGTDWTCDAETGALWPSYAGDSSPYRGAWWASPLVVTYTGGYAEVPADIKQATIVMAKHFADGMRNTGMFASERIGDYSYTANSINFPVVLPTLAVALLAPYALHAVA